MSYLLDTNHCICLLNGWDKPKLKQTAKEARIVKSFQSVRDEGVYLSEVTLGELYFGAMLYIDRISKCSANISLKLTA